MTGIRMDPQTTAPELPAATEIDPSVPDQRLAPVAPYWHTAVLVGVLLAIGLLSAWSMEHLPKSSAGPLGPYLQTIVMQWLLFAFVVFGLRRRGTTIADIMGARWRSLDDGLIDIALAGAVFVASLAVRAAIVFAMMKVTGTMPSVNDAIKSVERLIPHTPAEIGVAMLLALTAGIVEEFIFRGYLQRQFTAITKSVVLGITLPLAIFFVGHLYQGLSLQLLFVTLLGLALALLVHWRKNLRPAIILHAGQDMISLLFLSLFAGTLAK